MSNPWFRMYHEFATDPKVQMLSEADQRRYIMLLCLCCSNVNETLHDDAYAFQLRISIDEWMRTKEELIAKNLIDETGMPSSWNKRQYVSDSSTARVKRHREKVKQQGNVTCNKKETKTNVIDTDTDTDTEKESNKYKKISLKDLSVDVSSGAAKEFIDHRVNIKKPLTQNSFDRTMASVVTWQTDLNITSDQIITEIIDAGWQSARLDWLKKRLAIGLPDTPDAFDRLSNTDWANEIIEGNTQ